jgi:hypothetical protein
VTEAMLACTSGTLLCLDREQRLAYILGAIFGVSDTIAAEVLEITPENYRQRLARARRDLRNFMNEKCGLVNQANPCRCAKKTRGFIQAGHVVRTTFCSVASEFAKCGTQRSRRSQLSRPWTENARTSTERTPSTSRGISRRWCVIWSRVPT